MKKFGMKLIAMVLVLAVAVMGFAACGDNKDNGNAEDKTWLIGGSGPLTGPAASYGISVKNGAQIAVDEINAAGGINGYQIKWDMEDDQLDGEKAVQIFNSLLDKKMNMFLGTVTSTACIAVSVPASEENVFLLTPSGSAQDCTQFDNGFRVCFTDPLQGKETAKFLKTNFSDVKKIGLFYQSDSDYSAGIADAFCATTDLEVTKESFTTEQNTDFSAQISAFKNDGVELVFLPIYYQDAATFMSQATEKNLKVQFIGCDGLDGIIEEVSDKSQIEGVIYLTPFLATKDDEATQKFVKEYKEAYGETPDQFAADAYDGIYTLKAAAEKANATPDMTASEICDMLKDAMTKITVDGLTGSTTWTADGEPQKAAQFVKVVNGAAQTYTK